MSPQRIQLRRTKGWRKPEGVINVARPGKYGNPFKVLDCMEAGYASNPIEAHRLCVAAFSDWLNGDPWAAGASPDWPERRLALLEAIPELRGHDLACWCPLDRPCHADVLLKLANA